MDEKERQDKLSAQSHELYAAIGEFTVKFEQVSHAMQVLIQQVLREQGLQSQALADALLAGLTADPLRSILGAIMAELRPEPLDRTIMLNILKRIQNLTEQRNDIIHAMWFIGWASSDQTDFSSATSAKLRRSNSGATTKWRQADVATFAALSREAEALRGLLGQIGGLVMLNRTLGSNLVLDTKGAVQLPTS